MNHNTQAAKVVKQTLSYIGRTIQWFIWSI